MEQSVPGTPRRRVTPRSAHAPRGLRRLVGRAFLPRGMRGRRDIRHRREAQSFALVHPFTLSDGEEQHVLGVRPRTPLARSHFPGSPEPLGDGGYSKMKISRNRRILLKTNDRVTFYSKIKRGLFAPLLSHRMPSRAAQQGVKPRQVFSPVTGSKQSIEDRNKCQEIAIAFQGPSQPLSDRIRASNSGYDGARKFPITAATRGD
jgi:hypothetical protein